MNSTRFNIWKLTVLLLLFSVNANANELDTIRIKAYNETISIDSSGKVSSQIEITLNHQQQELLLPLLKSNSFKIKSGLNIKTTVVGPESNKYLQISSIDNKPLTNDIKLEVFYASMITEASFWNFFNHQKHKLYYSTPIHQMLEIDMVNIQLSLPSFFSVKLVDQFKDQRIQHELTQNGSENKLIIEAENTCLNKANFGIIIRNNSNSYITHILFILFLIGVYYVFLKYVINN